MAHSGFEAIEGARIEFLAWAQANGIPINRVEFVATFQDWDDGIGVWIFYDRNKDLVERNENGLSDEIKSKFMGCLERNDYPFADFPNVIYVFDSHENVQENYKGNYFYRLR